MLTCQGRRDLKRDPHDEDHDQQAHPRSPRAGRRGQGLVTTDRCHGTARDAPEEVPGAEQRVRPLDSQERRPRGTAGLVDQGLESRCAKAGQRGVGRGKQGPDEHGCDGRRHRATRFARRYPPQG